MTAMKSANSASDSIHKTDVEIRLKQEEKRKPGRLISVFYAQPVNNTDTHVHLNLNITHSYFLSKLCNISLLCRSG